MTPYGIGQQEKLEDVQQKNEGTLDSSTVQCIHTVINVL